MNREQQNELSKERILQAALQEFGEKEYAVASTNTMCKNHQISKGLLFHYYKTKEELFLVCVEKTFSAFSHYLEKHCIEEGQSVEEKLNHYFKARFSFFKEHPHYENIFIIATFNPPSQLIESIYEIRHSLREVNARFLKVMLDEVVLRDELQRDEIIKMILDFGDYLQIKYRTTYNEHPEEREGLIKEHNKTIEMMMNTIFYGIIKH